MCRMNLCFCCMLCLSACGSAPSTELSLKEHSDALTDQGDDNLFALHFDVGEEAFSFARISITAKNAEGKNYELSCTHADANSDGLWQKGESVTCKEPPINVFDASSVGKAISVQVSVQGEDGIYDVIASPQWTPEK